MFKDWLNVSQTHEIRLQDVPPDPKFKDIGLLIKAVNQCPQANEMLSSLIDSYPVAFGQAQWNIYFGGVGVEPPLPANIKEILASPCPIWPEKRIVETHMLVLIPQTVNGLPLTLNSLEELIKRPKEGFPTQYQDSRMGGHENTPSKASHWVLMTRDIIPGSRGKNYADQQRMIASVGGEAHDSYQVPTLIEATVCILMEHVRSGTRLFSPSTYTRCEEKFFSGSYQMVVGGFAPAGLYVYNFFYDDDFIGVAALRKF